ncbi:DUF7694 domain-containing protein [Vagococcus salmoninarum]|uniref:DUF7694 domain-containing protein n=1 Tax=Vagococcus salmoninarum TaxID=2739 RepID=A0A429ZSN4_9ENTE|nr:hypothetical protein [Vagococcus salmoninarum]RST96673.1 hypothetical protein CBF35_05420 [Vagococcus salmoninarum]
MKTLNRIVVNQDITFLKTRDQRNVFKWRKNYSNFKIVSSTYQGMDHVSISSPTNKNLLTIELMKELRLIFFPSNEISNVQLHAKSDTLIHNDVWHLFRSQDDIIDNGFGRLF